MLRIPADEPTVAETQLHVRLRRVVGRWADDEFLVILNGCREESLPVVRERLRRILANDSIDWWGERRSLPVSTGDATPQAGDTTESILERAQRSLEQSSQWLTRATTAGRNESSGS